jgi:hypothetical protein
MNLLIIIQIYMKSPDKFNVENRKIEKKSATSCLKINPILMGFLSS